MYKIIFILVAIFSIKTFSADKLKINTNSPKAKLSSKQLQIIKNLVEANTKLKKK